MRIFTYFLFFIGGLLLTSFVSDSRKISAHMTSQKLFDGKVIRIKGDVYYHYDEGKMIVHYTYPQEYIFMTNALGEVTFYYPESNQVMLQQNSMFSSENDALYFFLANKTESLGLREGGFELADTRVEDNNVITTWKPIRKADLNKISKVVLVHENHLPIYAAYFNSNNQVAKKIYYSDYLALSMAMLPKRITEIEYMANGDSIISKKEYGNIKTGFEAQSQYFDFKVPSDAKRISFNKDR